MACHQVIITIKINTNKFVGIARESVHTGNEHNRSQTAIVVT